MYLVFDTETTGRPKNYRGAMNDLDNWPRVIQLAWALYDKDKQLVNRRCDLIRPDGWVVPVEKFWIDNGYSTEKNAAEGIGIDEAARYFIESLNVSNYLVAHNMAFDFNVFGAELIRLKLSAARKPVKICTMEAGTEYCRLAGPRGYKWPSLTELHHKLFAKGFDGAHDAGFDVAACAACFFGLMDNGVIQL